MSKRVFRNMLAVLFVVLVLALIVILSGCTHYSVIKGAEGMPEYTEIKVWSNRQFEQPTIHLDKTPDSVKFDFGAGAVTTGTSPLEVVGAMTVQEMLNRMMQPKVEN